MTPDITTEYNAGRYVDLEIELADGTIVRERCERPRGSWGAEPISQAEHLVKVRDCLAGSLTPPAIDELYRARQPLRAAGCEPACAGCCRWPCREDAAPC